MNQIHHYRKYFYKEIATSINEVKNGAFYRLYGYKYDDGKTESYSAANTPLLLVLGKNSQKGLIHCIKLNELPLSRFLKLYDDIQNQSYTRELIKEIEDKDATFNEDLGYDTGRKAILIDRSGRTFYKKSVKNNRDLQKYDVYRTYKKKNVKMIKELYFDVSKLKPKLGFKNFNTEQSEII
jgi:hypothetical protein